MKRPIWCHIRISLLVTVSCLLCLLVGYQTGAYFGWRVQISRAEYASVLSALCLTAGILIVIFYVLALDKCRASTRNG